MEERFSIFKFFSQVFTSYGAVIVVLNIFCMLFGKSAYGISAIFSLGEAGVGVAVSFQFLLAIVLINVLRTVVETELVIRKIPPVGRNILMFTGAFLMIVIFSFRFDWFPIDMPLAWVLFVVCFVLSCTVSTLVCLLAAKQENRRLEEALKRYKEES